MKSCKSKNGRNTFKRNPLMMLRTFFPYQKYVMIKNKIENIYISYLLNLLFFVLKKNLYSCLFNLNLYSTFNCAMIYDRLLQGNLSDVKTVSSALIKI